MKQIGANILVVDDETNIRFFLQQLLTKEGHTVTAVASGEEAVARMQENAYDLALLDLKLTGIGGLDVMAALRQHCPNAGVIILTGHASLDTAVEALRRGANDYLFKPAKADELRESVRTVLAQHRHFLRSAELLGKLEQDLALRLSEIRALGTSTQPIPLDPPPNKIDDQPSLLDAGAWRVDLNRHTIMLAGNALALTPTEFGILAYLIEEAPRVVGQQELVAEVQGYEAAPWEARDTIRYHVFNIRRKLKQVTSDPQVIRTVRGVGYTVSIDTEPH